MALPSASFAAAGNGSAPPLPEGPIDLRESEGDLDDAAAVPAAVAKKDNTPLAPEQKAALKTLMTDASKLAATEETAALACQEGAVDVFKEGSTFRAELMVQDDFRSFANSNFKPGQIRNKLATRSELESPRAKLQTKT
ncbi:unnamed protein product, partial [Prorocentrum cordatum]